LGLAVSADKRLVSERGFQFGTGKSTSVSGLAQAVLDLAGSGSKISFEEPRTSDIRDSYADISKAQKLLGYKPQFGLKDGLRALLDEKQVTE